MWPRVGGLRSIALGHAGSSREGLNALVVSGAKRGTAGLVAEYEQEREALEHVGERLVILGNAGEVVATVRVTAVRVCRFDEVTWEFAASEGEGDADLASWRAGHRRYWAATGELVEDSTQVVCLSFEVEATA